MVLVPAVLKFCSPSLPFLRIQANQDRNTTRPRELQQCDHKHLQNIGDSAGCHRCHLLQLLLTFQASVAFRLRSRA